MKELEIAIKLRQCNDTIRKLYRDKDEFEKEMSSYKRFIQGAIKKHNLKSEIEGAMKLIEDAKDMEGADMFAVKTYTACVELMEGRL
jgi:hypothetical protein